jgi:hypothetical protein
VLALHKTAPVFGAERLRVHAAAQIAGNHFAFDTGAHARRSGHFSSSSQRTNPEI